MKIPHEYPDDFRTRMVALVRCGQTVSMTAVDLGVTVCGLDGWVNRDRMDRGEIEAISRAESRERRKAKRRIRELDDEVEILRRANEILGSAAQHPRGLLR